MGRLARTLTLIAAMVATMAAATGVAAADTLIRIEGGPGRSSATNNPILQRKAVTPQAYTAPASAPSPYTCAANSPIAALDAAEPGNWSATYDPTATGQKLTITKIAGVGPTTPSGGTTPNWSWAVYADRAPVDPCTGTVPPGTEVLFYPKCVGTKTGCYSGEPLYGTVGPTGELYPMTAPLVPYYNAPVSIYFKTASGVDPTKGTAISDEGTSFSSNDERGFGVAGVLLQNGGPHTITLTEANQVPVQVPVCATDGGDGFCGTTKTQGGDATYDPTVPCATNGHDGLCGTTDTSGPVTHVSNLKDQQTFAKKKAPGQVVGTIDYDPAAVKDVMLRLTRVSTARVRIKSKKKHHGKKKAKVRYRTVKRCTAWDDESALFLKAKCGPSGGKWAATTLDDLTQNFTYTFAMKLPPGTYTLEIQSHDLDNNVDAPEPGRNVIRFTVAKR